MEFTGLPLRISWGVTKPEQPSAPGSLPPGTGAAARPAAPAPAPAAATAGDQRVLVFRYSLPANGVTVDEANDRHLLLDLAATVFRADGKVVRTFEKQLDRHLTPDVLKTVRARPVSFEYTLEIPPGEYVVRFVMRDGISGKVGSIILPMKAE